MNNEVNENSEKLIKAEDVPMRRSLFDPFKGKDYEQDPEVRCDFDVAWRGHCNKPAILGETKCLEHFKIQCAMCESPSVEECSGTVLGFVCGSPLCENHKGNHSHGYGFKL